MTCFVANSSSWCSLIRSLINISEESRLNVVRHCFSCFTFLHFLLQNKHTLFKTPVDETEVGLLALLKYGLVDLEDEVADVDEVWGQISLDVDDSGAVEVVAEEGSGINL